MERRQQKRISLAQNFLKSPRLVRELVGLSTIGETDVVYEIGPGKGIITAELARRAKKVIGIEKDAPLAVRLRERFRANENIEIVEQDFLAHKIVDDRYKIFANIPYNRTAEIVRKIVYARPSPSEAYLIMQKEPAKKFAGLPRETLFSVLAKPYVEFEIFRYLNRTDFDPPPAVDSVILRIVRRNRPLIEKGDSEFYNRFVHAGFCSWKRNLRLAYKRQFSYKHWKRLARELRYPVDATPTELSFTQWLGLFGEFKKKSGELFAVSGRNRKSG